jgi:hypothetical protein
MMMWRGHEPLRLGLPRRELLLDLQLLLLFKLPLFELPCLHELEHNYKKCQNFWNNGCLKRNILLLVSSPSYA